MVTQERLTAVSTYLGPQPFGEQRANLLSKRTESFFFQSQTLSTRVLPRVLYVQFETKKVSLYNLITFKFHACPTFKNPPPNYTPRYSRSFLT